ncbi:MAG: hypothetical protein SCH66_14590 [Methanolobus sp.]|nr:hypothetical protein [Methanolobus sp.]
MNNAIFDASCEKCPNMSSGQCPNIGQMYASLQIDSDQATDHVHEDSIELFFECKEFPCKQIKLGPISFSFCPYLAGKAY